MSEFVPPHDEGAERSTLGAMLLSRDAIQDVAEVVSGPDFYKPAHETIYRTILGVHGRGDPVDAVTVGDALSREGEISRVGGAMYLHELAQACPSASAGAFYAEIVAKAATRRRLVLAGEKITQLARNGGDEDELVELARREVDATTKAKTHTVQSFGETIDFTIDSLNDEPNHVPTPWRAVNDIIGGLRPGGLYVIGARPSVGKSAIALQLAKGLTKHGSVAFSSLEMSRSDVQIRAVSSDLKIDLKRLIERDLTPGDWNKIRERRAAWVDVPLFIDDNSGASITDIKRFTRSVHRRRPLAGVVVDYLQLMSQQPGDNRARHEFVADMSRQLKILSMDLEIPVIALSQLNRSGTAREEKQPQLTDLRESGAIEQDADVVILLHREIMGPKRGDLYMMIAKNRHGSTNVAELDFYGHYSEARDKVGYQYPLVGHRCPPERLKPLGGHHHYPHPFPARQKGTQQRDKI